MASGNCHSPPPPYIPQELAICSKVWMRIDRVRKSLEAPYSGPFEVLDRHPKHYLLKLPQGNTRVSIDRLKPAPIRLLQAPSSVSNRDHQNLNNTHYLQVDYL